MSRFSKIQRRAAAKAAFLLLFAFGLPIISGCSACGYLIGSAIDKNGERGREVPEYHVNQIEPGENIRVVKTDGTLIEGKFDKITVYDDSVYSERYNSAKRDIVSHAVLPDLGDTITVQSGSGKKTTGEFIGYDLYFLDIFEARDLEDDINNGWMESAYQKVRIRPLSKPAPIQNLLLEDVDSVAYGNTKATVGIFREPSHSGTLPLRSAIVVETDKGEVTVPFDETARTRTFRKTKARWVLLAIGMAIDGLAIGIAIALASYDSAFGP